MQIKGYPVRLPLDVALVFTANPEDYTARGKIITPLKDRIGSEIRTHYPATVEEGIAITTQEAWAARNGNKLVIPKYVREVIERVAFAAREDKKIDKRSGVSQRLPISALENVISNAERRAIRHGENIVVPRIGDIYAALPAITGKLELEYEGEMKGADYVGRELIRSAIAKTYDQYFSGVNMQQVIQWFDLGGEIRWPKARPQLKSCNRCATFRDLMDKLTRVNVGPKDSPEAQVSAAEFALEGLHAHKAHRPQRRTRLHRRRKSSEGCGEAVRARRCPVSAEEAVELTLRCQALVLRNLGKMSPRLRWSLTAKSRSCFLCVAFATANTSPTLPAK